ncbi:MAG: GIY-YIG nuclease family protein, partial [Candidatus Moranbacteria bacterium]|nr:GIY-YIG nuclease family protein [Candidatus Moranbacteria bacterium]
MNEKYFTPRPDVHPTIYAYEIVGAENRKGLLKVGYTTRNAQDRIKEQLQTSGVEYKIVLEESAIRNDGSTFDDHEVHKYLKRNGIGNPDGEWFLCSVEDVRSAVFAIKNKQEDIQNRIYDYEMRPEQKDAVDKTFQYFRSTKDTTHFLWNAKMRFGKTFA